MGNRHYREERATLQVSKRRQKIKSKKTKQLNLTAFMVGLDGAGKSTILYKQMARSTYSSIPMQILPTITYNVETIRPKKSLISTQKHAPKPPIPPIPLPINNMNSYNSIQYQPTVPTSPHLQKQKQKQKRKGQKSESIRPEQISLNIYDYGGRISTRRLWTNYKQLKIYKIQKLQNTGNKIDFFILVVDCADLKRLNDEYYDSVQLAMKDLLNIKQYLRIPLCIFANKQDLNTAISSCILAYKLGLKCITVWDLIVNVKYVCDINLEYKLSKTILSFLPNINCHWNMSQRHWNVFDTDAMSECNQGIVDGIQWLCDQYGEANKNMQRKISFTQRFKMTM